MVDLTEFTGDQALRASIVKKRDKEIAKRSAIIAKAQEKLAPIEDEIAKYDELIAVIDRRAAKPEAKAVEAPAHWKDEQEGGDLADAMAQPASDPA